MKHLRISSEHPAYFENPDGSTFVPIGLNLCFFRNESKHTEAEIAEKYRFWMENFAANGGNYIRIWLGVPFFNVMPEKFGVFSESALSHIRFVVSLAEKLNLKIKFTLEHFRRIGNGADTELFPGAANFDNHVLSRSNGGCCDDMAEFLDSPAGREAYRMKARFLAENGIGDSPAVVAWELWNEVNCIAPEKRWLSWSRWMIPELEKLFPNQMILQNLGSFSGETAYRIYDSLSALDENAFMQAHRYLDPGAELDVCRGPMDVLCADVIRELRMRRPDRPAILAEAGAVEANHAAYSHLYEKDSEGLLLHDMIFAPFFAGSAGCGQAWHWDYIYVERHHLYGHFGRFALAIAGLDPVKEHFTPFYTETHELRVYGLRGRFHTAYWCKDKQSNWASELEFGYPAQPLENVRLFTENDGAFRCYDPWTDRESVNHSSNHSLTLPSFRRSMVVVSR